MSYPAKNSSVVLSKEWLVMTSRRAVRTNRPVVCTSRLVVASRRWSITSPILTSYVQLYNRLQQVNRTNNADNVIVNFVLIMLV